jgi:hypothetical protein
MPTLRSRFWIETTLALSAALLALLAVVRRDWIEAILPIDPDGHGGSLEWLLAAASLGVSLVAAAAAREEHARVIRRRDGLRDQEGGLDGRAV